MNKTELINTVAEKTDMSKKDADKAVNAVIDTIIDTIVQEDKVQLVGFGTFEIRNRGERMGRNPQTKEPMPIPASKVPVFKAGKAFKDAVSK